jgi:hypothetical protein
MISRMIFRCGTGNFRKALNVIPPDMMDRLKRRRTGEAARFGARVVDVFGFEAEAISTVAASA